MSPSSYYLGTNATPSVVWGRICLPGRYQATAKSSVYEYVIRMLCFGHAWFEQEVALLIFLATTNVPAPLIKFYDLSSENTLGSRYTMQLRVPGESVEQCYLDLSTAQRISFAQKLGQVLKIMEKYSFSCPGTLDLVNMLSDSAAQILRVQCPPHNARRPPSGEAAMLSATIIVYEFITSQLGRQHKYDVSLLREHLNPWAPFRIIIDEMNARGLFDDNAYYLTHMDFEPRNIFVHTTSPTTANLSAILDWDEAVFAPVFLTCRPPSWLSDFEGDNDEELDGHIAHKTPADEDLAAIKAAFEKAVGHKYLKYAYKPEYRLARDITRLAIAGIGSNEDYEACERVLKEWNEMFPEKEVGGMED